MQTSCRLVLAIVFLLPVSAFAQTLQATLSGANQVPPADPDATGTATILVSGTTLTYTITTQNLTLPPLDQHIHQGAAGVNGPIFIPLPGTWVGGNFSGTTTASAADIAAVVANPSGFYVNVHTTDFPGGSIRGQLQQISPTIPTLSYANLLMLAAVLAVAGLLAIRKI
ncbi:MAG TPA: CHRD domain-containing protein [Thermoanaerobaculia bacterium]|jgi:hypothetical protein